MPTETSPTAPKHHVDRRARQLAAEIADGGDTDQLLSTSELSELTGLSSQFFEIGRSRGYGPRFVACSPRRIRYRRADVVEWLNERTYHRTSEYEHAAAGRKPGDKVVDGRVVRPGDAA
jgi:predicted DNA-binding transcriptional regulator AlpA